VLANNSVINDQRCANIGSAVGYVMEECLTTCEALSHCNAVDWSWGNGGCTYFQCTVDSPIIQSQSGSIAWIINTRCKYCECVER
jgi:hypothetical protein